MATVTPIGLDIGKHGFHLAGHDHRGDPILKSQFTRSGLIDCLAQCPACRIVMDACCGEHGCYANGRLGACGATDPAQIRPFVTGHKNDCLGVLATCEAAARSIMRHVAPKACGQQALSARRRRYEAHIAERARTNNQIHALLLEFGSFQGLTGAVQTMDRA
jgi:transposase